jgi:glutamyl-tRNA synthetase
VNPNAARFDLKKCEAINAAHVRMLSDDELVERILPYLHDAGLVDTRPSDEQRALLGAAVPLIRERINTLAEAVDMLGFLFVDEADFRLDPGDAAKLLDAGGRDVVAASYNALSALETWDTPAIEAALRSALVDGLGLKPRLAFGPVRVAVTGRRVSPPLFESMELLGRRRSLDRLHRAGADAS